MNPSAGTLYVVSTPIGNMEDVTLRALRVLGEVSCIAAEDTRHTRKLLTHYELTTPLTSYHDHNEAFKAPQLVERLLGGDDVALVSDGGTPNISDPGYTLVRLALEAGVDVVPIPGASAVLSAAAVCGLPLHDFFFAGFCSPKSGRRRRRMESLSALPSTIIFYESPHRVLAFLRDAEDVFGNRRAVAMREVTKLHEEAVRGSIRDLRDHFEASAPRGEFTFVIGGCEESS